MTKIDNLTSKIFVATLWIIPFYLPFAVWAASNFGYIYVFSAWKEFIMALLLLALATPLLQLLRSQKSDVRILNITVLAYVFLNLLYIFSADSLFEFVAGALFATRFLLFFLIAQALAMRFKLLPERIARIVLISGAVLAGIAMLQALALPPTLLRHIGYEPLGIETPGFPPSVTTLGEVSDFIRPQASLRGPNPLGAFLVLPFCLLVWMIVKAQRKNAKHIVALILIGLALLFTFSRSAWIAAFVGTAGILLYSFRPRLKTVKTSWVLTVVAILTVVSLIGLNNKTVRVIVLREENNNNVRLSDNIRSSLTKEAWKDVISHPLGRGPGNAGPVSVLDQKDRGRIAENYFLQVAQETGWIGLALFIAAHALLLRSLWSLRNNGLAMVAFATLVGLIIANLTLHTWADEAVSILWWSFAGAIIGTYIKTNKKAKHG